MTLFHLGIKRGVQPDASEIVKEIWLTKQPLGKNAYTRKFRQNNVNERWFCLAER
jgi:hypothetical protein